MKLRIQLFFILLFLMTFFSVNSMTFVLDGTATVSKPSITEDAADVKNTEELNDADLKTGDRITLKTGSLILTSDEDNISVGTFGIYVILNKDDKASFVINDRGLLEIESLEGDISVSIGNTTLTLKAGDKIACNVDDVTGVQEIQSIKGNISTNTVGVGINIPEGSSALILANPTTRTVLAEAKTGSLEIISIDGDVTPLSQGAGVSEHVAGIGTINNFGVEPIDVTGESDSLEPVFLPPLRANQDIMESAQVESLLSDVPNEPARPEGSEYVGS